MTTEYLLSADDRSRARRNAVVIALAVGTLPRRHLLGRVWGTLGAVVMRIGSTWRRGIFQANLELEASSSSSSE